MSDQISIIAPDDWHVHLRDGEMLNQVVAHTARRFQRAIVMPNLRPGDHGGCCTGIPRPYPCGVPR